MLYLNEKYGYCHAMTILEMVIALAIITLIFAAVLPQFRAIKNGWDSRQADAEVLQNGRVLIDHIARNLSKAVKITTVSESTETDGFIQFQDNDGNNFRYDINSTSNYVEFGPVGNLSDLAGPVSQLVFTCYDACDLDTPLDITTADINDIRYVEIDTTIINSFSASQNITFTAAAYLRTNDEAVSDCNLVAWWKMNGDANDSADGGYHGTVNGNPTWGSGGPYDGSQYLDCDGSGDYIDANYLHLSAILLPKYTISMWFRVDGGAGTNRDLLSATSDSAGNNHGILLELNSSNQLRYLHRHPFGGSGGENIYTTDTYGVSTTWHHVAAVRESNTSMILYVDGTVAGSSSNTTGEFDAPVKVFLGTLRPSLPRDWDGGIDDVRIYNAALDANEIAELARAGVSYEDFSEAKLSSDDTSITIPTSSGSGVGTLGSWTNGLTHTAESGSNRLLILTAHVEDNDADMSLDSVTYGGQSMTKVIETETQEGNFRAYVVAYILDEADIAAASGNTFSPTWSSTPDSVEYSSVFLQDVNQSDPIGSSDSDGTNSNDSTITTGAISTNNGDMVIVAGTCGNTGNYSVDNGFTEAIELTIGSADGVAGYKSADGSNETPSITHSNANRQVIIGFVVQGTGVVSGIEGDLLIAAVATDGDTSASLSPPVGEGWTEIDVDDWSSAVTLGAWWKLADASESTAHEFTWSGGQKAYGWIMRFTGHNSSSPINDWAADGETSSSPTSPAVTTTIDNCLILRLGAFDNSDITTDSTGLSGHTDITMDESGSTSTILFQDGFETSFDNWTDGGTTNWDRTTAQYVSGSYSAHAGSSDDDLISDNIDMSSYSYFTIDFWYRDDNIDSGEALFQLYDGSTYDTRADLGTTSPEDTWHNYNETIYNSGAYTQYFINNFRIKFEASSLDPQGGGENLWIDDVTITVPGSGAVSGGAGYIRQPSSGSSGTADFALTSSNASQMITIAIAPDPPDPGCSGNIFP